MHENDLIFVIASFLPDFTASTRENWLAQTHLKKKYRRGLRLFAIVYIDVFRKHNETHDSTIYRNRAAIRPKNHRKCGRAPHNT